MDVCWFSCVPATALPIYRGDVKVTDEAGKFLIKLPIKAFHFFGSTDKTLKITCTICLNKGCSGIVRMQLVS